MGAYMANRDFSDSVKLNAITENLRNNNGEIRCTICGTKLSSINECHFDHIFPFAKGGKSTTDNCQILCISCNLKKNDKELQDFLLEEKARRFLAGESAMNTDPTEPPTVPKARVATGSLSKEAFDQIIHGFIASKGDIHTVDFGRAFNNLPSIHYVKKYYGDLNTMKRAFGVEDRSANWNRETIEAALRAFIAEKGDFFEKDLKKKNKLPSLPCILNYFPEYKGLTELKKGFFHLNVRTSWSKERAIEAGKAYVAQHGILTESSLRAENNLPTSKAIYGYFGSLAAYQEAIGSEISGKNEYVSPDDIERAVNEYFGDGEKKVESMKTFFKTFPYSSSTIHKRFGSFTVFCERYGIIVEKTKKAKYSKQEVDDAIAKWIKSGKDIPHATELSKLGLPSMSVILKYYEDWKEPFVLYKKMYDKLNNE